MKARALMMLLALSGFAYAQEEIGSFVFVEEVDPIDDADTSYIFVTADEASAASTPRLFIRCTGETLEVVYTPDEFLTSDEPVLVLHRFDSDPPSEPAFWDISASGTAAFARSRTWRPFLERASSANQVVIRTSDYRGQQYTHTFALEGFEEAFSHLECSSVLEMPVPQSSTVRRLNLGRVSEEEVREVVLGSLESDTYTEEPNVLSAEGVTVRYRRLAGVTEVTVGGDNAELVEAIAEALEQLAAE